MNTVCRDIFRAVHEGKWLSIEYKNGKNEITKYWIGIISINPIKKSIAAGYSKAFKSIKRCKGKARKYCNKD